MKLNPSKCAFRVSSGKFLEFMVSHMGIKANPDNIQAILNMKPPRNIKEVQSLTRQVVALNRFVSKATDKCLPFFKVLKKALEWTDECQKAFQDLKAYLTTAPLLSLSILSNVLTCSEFSINQKRRENIEACLLHKPNAEWSKGTVSYDGKAGLCICNSFQEAKALLPSSCHQCLNRSSIQEGNEQVGSRKTTDPIGHKT